MIATEARMFSYEQAAERMGMTHKHRAKTVSRLVASGKLVATKFSYRSRMINELDLLKFLNEARAVEKLKRNPWGVK